jgi:hypothetical protein
MFGNKKRRLDDCEDKQAWERYERALAAGRELNRRLAELHETDLSRFQGELQLLLAEAERQTDMIQQSIEDRTGYSIDGDVEGDRFTFLAEMIAGVMRENIADPQTERQALANTPPEVRFTVHWYDAVAMAAAMFRQQRIASVIEGLQLARLWK